MANMTEDEKEKMFSALRSIQDQQHKTNQALFGDESIGLNGVVKDLASIKHWRNEVALKTGSMAGAVAIIVTVLTLFGKYLVMKVTGKD